MVYNYTIPRGPIAAEYSSPGPKYMLPGLVGQPQHDPRSIHNKGPAWAFGTRHGKTRDDSSPGPCYFPVPKIYRDGRDGTPQYSLYSRTRTTGSFSAPGPGAYRPQDATQAVAKAYPAYSFGLRHIQFRTDNTPGPNAYAMDGMLGRTMRSDKKSAPCYSLTGKSKTGSFHEDLQKTPGPGAYTVVSPTINKSKPPQYSMTGRNQMPGDSTKIPGPGAYQPQQVTFNRRSAPQFSFGIRHSQYKGEFISDVDLDEC